MKAHYLFLLPVLVLLSFGILNAQVKYPGKNPGNAIMNDLPDGKVIIENNVLRMDLFNNGKNISITGFKNKETNEFIQPGNKSLFEITFQNNSKITSDDFSFINPPKLVSESGNINSTVYAERLPGRKYVCDLRNIKHGISLHLEADLRNGSNYIKNTFIFKSDNPDNIKEINLIKFPVATGARKSGIVDGSPVVIKNLFFAVEHPLGKTVQDKKFIRCYMPWMINDISTVWGVTPGDQLRRGFLYYLERERLHGYHHVLHYNSWYDISWDGRKFNEEQSLDRIKMFGDSLIRKRNVSMKGFLFDDGWDDNKTLWKFHSGFPEGFKNLKTTAAKYDSEIGVWLSPFGGYGEAKNARIEYGNKQNPPFETNEQGFSLSGPVYYNRFKEVTGSFIKDYNISMFKFDGVGRGSGAETIYQKDVEAFLALLKDLHSMKPDLYFSLTTGTWPSVYWLKYGDNIWRGGDDTNMTGEGSNRQKWITYRDAETYKNIVKAGPLFPLNSLMLCGICIADNGYPGQFEMDDMDIRDEIWSFFATGTNLQELYVNPHKLNTKAWDCLAEAAKWASKNESVMTDVHWTGGDPAKGDIYGFAAWSPHKAILSLRNPSAIEKSVSLKTRDIFELYGGISDEFSYYDVMSGGNGHDNKFFTHEGSFTVSLKPFKVKVFDFIPEHNNVQILERNADFSYENLYRSMAANVSKERIKNGVYYISDDPLPRRVLNDTLPGHTLSTLEEADIWIETQLTEKGYKPWRDETKVRAFGRDFSKPLAHQYSTPPDNAPIFTANNILAEKKGTVDPGKVIVVIAHKDSQSWIASPGANDNAVGTSASIELARVMKDYRPRHTVRFIFCNEEHTPWTSITAVNNIRNEGLDVLAAINMDAVGGKPQEQSGKLINVTRYTTPEGERLADLNAMLNDRFSIGLEQRKYRSETPGDDDGSFINGGFPWAILNIGSMPYGDPNYHLETDTADKVDYDTTERVVKLTLALILHLDHNGRP